ncbi:hypothetical protein [Nocardioides convexus]|uniref:hypothetical protein n=1 Tax=Nocardioides convexus TaxID=2712224 RepID=UPI0024185248|nr:hypothetical protein [Nocardioides convexus]
MAAKAGERQVVACDRCTLDLRHRDPLAALIQRQAGPRIARTSVAGTAPELGHLPKGDSSNADHDGEHRDIAQQPAWHDHIDTHLLS